MNTAVDIKVGDFRSIDEIMPIMEAAFDPAFGEAWTAGQCLAMLTIPGTRLLVASQSETIAGFALSRTVVDESELLLIATHPSFQGQGIGTQLARAVIEDVAKNGSKLVFLEVREGNPALSLYLRVGFLQVGRREKYYRGKTGEYFNALTLRYEIES